MWCQLFQMNLAIFVCILLCLQLVSSSKRLAPLYSRSTLRGENQYIVKLQNDVDTSTFAKNIESMLTTMRYTDCQISFRYNRIMKGFLATLNGDSLTMVRELALVAHVESDSEVSISAVGSWGLDRIDQRNLPLDGIYQVSGDGTDAHVYIIDTGILPTHQDFTSRADVAYDALDGDGIDCNGHGTHCAGTAAGMTYGVAKNVKVHGVRVLNCDGIGLTSDVLEGMDWVAENADKPAVASMSLGGGYSRSMNNAADALTEMGIVLVAASGNEQANACTMSPASAATAITVSASDINDDWASFSNRGPCVDVIAPGVDITSAWYTSPTATAVLSGTSMACPHVAGAVAILLANDPSLTPEEVKQNILSMGTPGVIAGVPPDTSNILLYVN